MHLSTHAPRARAALRSSPLPPVLLLDGVHKDYRAGIPGCCARARVLRAVHLRVSAGELVGIAGAPGAGKTTLLLCAAGLLRPDAGSVRWGPSGALPPGGAPGAAYVSADAPERVGRARSATVREALARPGARPLFEASGAAAPALLLLDDAPLLLGERAGLVLRWLAELGVAVVATARDPRWLLDIGARTFTLSGGTLCRPLTAGTARRPG